MVSTDMQSQVIDLVAQERGLPRDKVHLSSRLLQDLGMDGDDAVDFFNSVHERFGTDLTHLYELWGDYFGPEGFSCWNGLVIMPAAVIGGVAAGLLGLGALAGFGITIALLVLWFWTMKKWGPPDRMKTITVAEVVDAVETGAWQARSRLQ